MGDSTDRLGHGIVDALRVIGAFGQSWGVTVTIEEGRPLAIVGAGYVGLVTGAHLAACGREVILLEVDPHRREMIARGETPIYEPGLSEMLRRVTDAGTLTVGADLAQALSVARMVVIAVGTPPLPDGRADLSALERVGATIAEHAAEGTVVVIKSTVPPGTGRALQRRMDRTGRRIHVVNCPEFLREGCALEDIANSDRFVAGGSDDEAISRVIEVMNPLRAPVLRTSNAAAELIKYGSNAFLAVKISFINEMANLCDTVEADVDDVARGMGMDSRIGSASMRPGLGFGGSCFPKDVAALEHAARREGFSFWLLRSATEVNEQQRMRFVQKIREAVGGRMEGRRVAMLGLAFKPGTDDMRQAPSLAIAHRLIELGATVVAHDPVAGDAARDLIPEIDIVADPYAAIAGADVVAVVTEWPEYLALDWQRAAHLMRHRVIVDGRNCLDATVVAAHGFNYHAMGRPTVTTRWDRRASDRVAVKENAA
jgi:UDPglucose 6-dehydrogenase